MSYAPVDFNECRRCACAAARRASRALSQRFDAEMRPSGLRIMQFTALATLTLSGAVTMTRLAELMGLERTTLTRNLKPLLRDGLVEIRQERDGRVRRVAITAKGETAARAAFPLWRRAQDSALAPPLHA
jgi:DNA-binding MarR family transcriptional regulator